jgi:DNA polymerase-3 subunit delta
MQAEKIINELKKQNFKPVYWLDGDEEFFIDQVIAYAESEILTEGEKGFNLTVFYGRDASWPDVVNACRRYPMFADRQVVILKEAQAMRDIDKLEGYIDKPLSSTLLFIAYKNKKVDGRTKLAKLLKDKAVVFTTKKLYDKDLPEWTTALLSSKGYSINNKALFLLIDHIGNDLNRLNNEIDKLALNLGTRKTVTEDDIENYVGISKEFNVFELQQAVAARDLYKAMRIVQYLKANPKAAPLQLIFPTLYGFLTKLQQAHALGLRDENGLKSALGLYNVFQARELVQSLQRYAYADVEKMLLLLYEYNLRSLGINDAGTDDGELLSEMVVKMLAA